MNNFPTVDYVIHTTDKIEKLGTVKFRTFTVGEHRQFLEANQLGDENAIFDTLLSMIEACTFGAVAVRKTEMYLLDALYLEIFIRSKGATVPANYKCSNQVPVPPAVGESDTGEMKACGANVTVNVPLSNAYIHYPEGYKESAIIHISDTSGLKLRQPTPDEYLKSKKDAPESAAGISLTDQFMYSSIECVFDGDRVMVPGVDYDLPGLVKYINTLPDQVVDQLQAFYDLTPILRLELPIKCPKCGHTEKIVLEGLDDFFA